MVVSTKPDSDDEAPEPVQDVSTEESTLNDEESPEKEEEEVEQPEQFVSSQPVTVA